MSYANGTTHYNLPQTVGTDKRDWSDTNQAFADVDAALYGAATAASGAATDVAALTTRVGTLETSMGTAQTDIAALQASDTQQDTSILALETRVTTDEADISAAKTALTRKTVTFTTNEKVESGYARLDIAGNVVCLCFSDIKLTQGGNVNIGIIPAEYRCAFGREAPAIGANYIAADGSGAIVIYGGNTTDLVYGEIVWTI